eukprot:CAMPEP_0176496462 /NCGR_PEP_ID=MMETSP0200_2-20121128/11207_1 /TAXON_ID=947934 /ORGANISM="Chaetoceros sp., Strain GSL56" /LENGTH=801 /DNA_ID=CAMNT_0017894417 /DNA_START=65 /DNA_END=2470 /DNA_ORIENTATION=+
MSCEETNFFVLGKSEEQDFNTNTEKKRSDFEQSVGKSIQRGRAALAQAKDHYLQTNRRLLSRGSRLSQDFSVNQISEVDSKRISENQFDRCFEDGDDGYDEFMMDTTSNSDVCQESIIENDDEEANMVDVTNADSFFSSAFSDVEYEDDSSTDAEFRGLTGYHHQSIEDFLSKPRPKRLFDPSRLSGHRGTSSSKVNSKKMRMLGNGKLGQQEMFKPFKARPLPCGHYVNNDPYAMTKAALDKIHDRSKNSAGTVGEMGAAGGDVQESFTTGSSITSKQGKQIIDAAVILGGPTSSKKNSRSFSSSIDNSVGVEQDQKQQERRTPNRIKKSKVGKDIYEATTRLISKEFEYMRSSSKKGEEQSSFDDASSAEDEEEEDMVNLHQKIAKLEAELRMRRRKCLETICALEDETRCKSLNDIGIPEFQKIEEQQEGKEQNEESLVSGGENINVEQSFVVADKDEETTNVSLDDHQNKKHERQKPKSLYLRQKAWLDDLDRKRKEAKDREVNELLRDVTGKPMVTRTSWSRAKEEHDALVEIAKKREQELIKQKKIEKENTLRRLLDLKEMEKKVQVAPEQASTSTSNHGGDQIKKSNNHHYNNNIQKKKVVDPQKQADYFNKLSQPLKRFKPCDLPTSSSRSISIDSTPLVDEKKEENPNTKQSLTEQAYRCSTNAPANMNNKKESRTFQKHHDHPHHKDQDKQSDNNTSNTSSSNNNNNNNNNNNKNDKNIPNEKISISFADMDDNEFAKVIQRILQQNAKNKKETRQNNKATTRKSEVVVNKHKSSTSTAALLPYSPYKSRK